MDLHLQVVHFTSHIADVLLINVNFYLVLILGSFLFVQEQRVLRLDVGHFIIQSKEVMFEILKLKKLLFERSDDCVFVGRFYLVEMEVT